MNKKVLMSLAIIILVVAAVGGATTAWFTAKAELENTFTAGTVLISADEVDVLEGDMGNVNPGDCFTKLIDIDNDGSKKIFLRLRMAEVSEWVFDWDHLWDNWDALCFSEYGERPGYSSAEWEAFKAMVLAYLEANADSLVTTTLLPGVGYTVQGPDADGWFYVVPDGLEPLHPGETLQVKVKVCFDGPLMKNYFQAATYTHFLTFEAIQASNDAAYFEWGVGHYGTP